CGQPLPLFFTERGTMHHRAAHGFQFSRIFYTVDLSSCLCRMLAANGSLDPDEQWRGLKEWGATGTCKDLVGGCVPSSCRSPLALNAHLTPARALHANPHITPLIK